MEVQRNPPPLGEVPSEARRWGHSELRLHQAPTVSAARCHLPQRERI